MGTSTKSNVEYANSDGIDLPSTMAKIDEVTSKGTELTPVIGASVDLIVTALTNTGNSNQFNLGEEAQSNKDLYGSIKETTGSMQTEVDTLKGMKDTIGATIAEYNRNLKELKKRSKLKALQDHVDAINGTVVEEHKFQQTLKTGPCGTISVSQPADDYIDCGKNYKMEVYWDIVSSNYNQEDQTTTTVYDVTQKKKVNIDYDSLIKSNADTSGFWSGLMKLLDDDYETLYGKVSGVANSYPNKGLEFTNEIDDSTPIEEWCEYTPK